MNTQQPLLTLQPQRLELWIDRLFLLFLALKLAQLGYPADWSWWWITAPLWIGYPLQILLPLLAPRWVRILS